MMNFNLFGRKKNSGTPPTPVNLKVTKDSDKKYTVDVLDLDPTKINRTCLPYQSIYNVDGSTTSSLCGTNNIDTNDISQRIIDDPKFEIEKMKILLLDQNLMGTGPTFEGIEEKEDKITDYHIKKLMEEDIFKIYIANSSGTISKLDFIKIVNKIIEKIRYHYTTASASGSPAAAPAVPTVKAIESSKTNLLELSKIITTELNSSITDPNIKDIIKNKLSLMGLDNVLTDTDFRDLPPAVLDVIKNAKYNPDPANSASSDITLDMNMDSTSQQYNPDTILVATNALKNWLYPPTTTGGKKTRRRHRHRHNKSHKRSLRRNSAATSTHRKNNKRNGRRHRQRAITTRK